MAGQAATGPVRRLTPAVRASLAVLELDPRDQAAARLAELYAQRLDAAAVVAGHADRVLRAAASAEDPDLYEQLGALRSKLAEQVALTGLGARLEAVLAALGATPAARAKSGAPSAAPQAGRLQAFRGGAAS